MRIAIMGTRGVPASYGGFETFAERLSTLLVARGHEVTVYCRSHYVPAALKEYKGVRLKVLPTIRHKYFDTIAHTFLSALHGMAARYDAALVCNAANAPFIPLVRLAGTPVAINVDGLEHKRKKWNWMGRRYYLLCEQLAAWFSNEVVTDARVIQQYYMMRYNTESTMIAYGADIERRQNREAVSRWGVEPEGYVLYVSRLEPENNAHLVIEAFKQVETRHKLLIVGDAPYAVEYKNELRALATGDERIVLTGFVFGEDYRALQQNAYCYVHATEVGGTHPALIEAMGYGNCVLALATPENLEVVGDAAITYGDSNELTEQLQRVLRDEAHVNAYRQRAQARVQKHYDWESIVDRYESLFAKLTGQKISKEKGKK